MQFAEYEILKHVDPNININIIIIINVFFVKISGEKVHFRKQLEKYTLLHQNNSIAGLNDMNNNCLNTIIIIRSRYIVFCKLTSSHVQS